MADEDEPEGDEDGGKAKGRKPGAGGGSPIPIANILTTIEIGEGDENALQAVEEGAAGEEKPRRAKRGPTRNLPKPMDAPPENREPERKRNVTTLGRVVKRIIREMSILLYYSKEYASPKLLRF